MTVWLSKVVSDGGDDEAAQWGGRPGLQQEHQFYLVLLLPITPDLITKAEEGSAKEFVLSGENDLKQLRNSLDSFQHWQYHEIYVLFFLII